MYYVDTQLKMNIEALKHFHGKGYRLSKINYDKQFAKTSKVDFKERDY